VTETHLNNIRDRLRRTRQRSKHLYRHHATASRARHSRCRKPFNGGAGFHQALQLHVALTLHLRHLPPEGRQQLHIAGCFWVGRTLQDV
jgi:hypothetical protein